MTAPGYPGAVSMPEETLRHWGLNLFHATCDKPQRAVSDLSFTEMTLI
jgi:hypothetical protein